MYFNFVWINIIPGYYDLIVSIVFNCMKRTNIDEIVEIYSDFHAFYLS